MSIEPQVKTTPNRPQLETNSSDLFEKKYASKLDKLDETMGSIQSSLSEMKQMKKDKLESRKREKEEKEKKETLPEKEKELTTNRLQAELKPQAELITNRPQAELNPNKIPKSSNYRSFFKR